jgi:uncharacterized membrane protein YeaQ/YmgE (transglycosylase-associated protein family)
MLLLLTYLLIGIIEGFVAAQTLEGQGFGFYGDIVVGVIGSFAGGLLAFQILGEAFGFGGAIILSGFGSAILLLLTKLIWQGPTNSNIRTLK